MGLIENTGLPFEAEKTFVCKNIAIGKVIDHSLCCKIAVCNNKLSTKEARYEV